MGARGSSAASNSDSYPSNAEKKSSPCNLNPSSGNVVYSHLGNQEAKLQFPFLLFTKRGSKNYKPVMAR